jgi:hypothetical protein
MHALPHLVACLHINMNLERIHAVSMMVGAAVAVPTAVITYLRLEKLLEPVPHMYISAVYNAGDEGVTRRVNPRLHICFGNAGAVATMHIVNVQMFVNGKPVTTWESVIGDAKLHDSRWRLQLPFEPTIATWTAEWRFFAPKEYAKVARICPVDNSVDDTDEAAAQWVQARKNNCTRCRLCRVPSSTLCTFSMLYPCSFRMQVRNY